MKRILSFLFLAAAIIFFSPSQSLAQCNQSGAWYDCYSYSNNSNFDVAAETWLTDGTAWWVTVSLQANHPTDGYAYAEATTNTGYRNDAITQGTFQDNYTLPGAIGTSLTLYAAARYGSAYIGASW